ncbi:MAG: hypothetical protein AAGJ56_08710 [Myxococcota bacterium]
MPPPRPSAAFEERVAFHDDHQPRLTKETHVTTFQRTNPTAALRQTDYLLLNDGRRIYDPEDLTPVVPEDSRTAAAIEQWSRERNTRWTLQAENDEAATAYEFYGESLREGLGLCVDNDSIVDCE